MTRRGAALLTAGVIAWVTGSSIGIWPGPDVLGLGNGPATDPRTEHKDVVRVSLDASWTAEGKAFVHYSPKVGPGSVDGIASDASKATVRAGNPFQHTIFVRFGTRVTLTVDPDNALHPSHGTPPHDAECLITPIDSKQLPARSTLPYRSPVTSECFVSLVIG